LAAAITKENKGKSHNSLSKGKENTSGGSISVRRLWNAHSQREKKKKGLTTSISPFSFTFCRRTLDGGREKILEEFSWKSAPVRWFFLCPRSHSEKEKEKKERKRTRSPTTFLPLLLFPHRGKGEGACRPRKRSGASPHPLVWAEEKRKRRWGRANLVPFYSGPKGESFHCRKKEWLVASKSVKKEEKGVHVCFFRVTEKGLFDKKRVWLRT